MRKLVSVRREKNVRHKTFGVLLLVLGQRRAEPCRGPRAARGTLHAGQSLGGALGRLGGARGPVSADATDAVAGRR